MTCNAIVKANYSSASGRVGGSRGGTRGGATRKRHEGRCEGALREARGAARVRGGRRRVGVGWRTIG